MKKRICITPVDNTMLGWTEALYLLNEFRRIGYTKREVFVQIVLKTKPEYTEYKKVQQLYHFWAMRERSNKIIKDLKEVLQTLDKQK